mmetsp:Transcript_1636/g.4238  ORF Transcript_1636/g.4238 Transcript_1636/m.4238 type:complete len:273 (-) Transcript_1636:315-1133(-)
MAHASLTSSIWKCLKSFVLITTSAAATRPITLAYRRSISAPPPHIATSPAMMELLIAIMSIRSPLLTISDHTTAPRPDIAEETVAFTADIDTLEPPSSSITPSATKMYPYHPHQIIMIPDVDIVKLWGTNLPASSFCHRLAREPTIKAPIIATVPPTTCTTPEPASSTNGVDSWERKPPPQVTRTAPACSSETMTLKMNAPFTEVLSAIAPEITEQTMVCAIMWNAMSLRYLWSNMSVSNKRRYSVVDGYAKLYVKTMHMIAFWAIPSKFLA